LDDTEAAERGKYGEDAELEYGPGPLEGSEVAVPELEVREVEEEADEWTGEPGGTVEQTFAVFAFDEEGVEGAGDLVPGTEQTVVLVRARSAEDALIVPLSALWTDRSEEHTSELQSRENLVCRLLLEKKKEPTAGEQGRL